MLVRSRHPADAPRHYAAIGVVLVVSFGMISGLLVVRSPAAAFAVAILVLGIASINVGVEYLVASAVAIAWLGKFGVQVVGLPRFVEFLHFPVIAVALAQSIIRRPREAERLGRRE